MQTVTNIEDKFNFNPYSSDFIKNPYTTYKHMRNNYPVYKYNTFTNEQILITKYNDIKYVLTSKNFEVEDLSEFVPTAKQLIKSTPQELSLLKQSLKPWLFFLNPPDHNRLRNIVNREFTIRAVKDMQPYIENVVGAIFGKLNENKRFEAMSELARPLPILVSAKMLGISVTDIQDFVKHSEVLFSIFEQPLTFKRYQEMVDAAIFFDKTISEEINLRGHNRNNNDLLDILLSSNNDHVINKKELLGFSAMLFSVGQETTENYIGNSILALMNHRDQFDLLCKKPELIDNAVMELARFDTAVQFISRVARQDMDISGYKIKSGDRCYLVLGSANRDEDQFSSPDTLDLNRKNIGNLPFGSGIHFCLGRALAKLQLKVVLQHLIRFPEVQISADNVQRRKTAIIRGVKHLELFLP